MNLYEFITANPWWTFFALVVVCQTLIYLFDKGGDE